MDASRVRPTWDLALRAQLRQPIGIDPETGETLYRSTAAVAAALRVLSLGRPRPREE
jgi:hypothetical protein